MTIAEFFTSYQMDAHCNFVDAELREIFQSTTTQDENFDLDVPF